MGCIPGRVGGLILTIQEERKIKTLLLLVLLWLVLLVLSVSLLSSTSVSVRRSYLDSLEYVNMYVKEILC